MITSERRRFYKMGNRKDNGFYDVNEIKPLPYNKGEKSREFSGMIQL
jgi:hypothetical protein